MRISDWSSDVCSSDLVAHRVEIGQDRGAITAARHRRFEPARQRFDRDKAIVERKAADIVDPDRKSVVSGKSVSVRVDIGGRRTLTNKTNKKKLKTQEKET